MSETASTKCHPCAGAMLIFNQMWVAAAVGWANAVCMNASLLYFALAHQMNSTPHVISSSFVLIMTLNGLRQPVETNTMPVDSYGTNEPRAPFSLQGLRLKLCACAIIGLFVLLLHGHLFVYGALAAGSGLFHFFHLRTERKKVHFQILQVCSRSHQESLSSKRLSAN